MYNFDVTVDIDLRKEFAAMINGTDTVDPIGKQVVLQTVQIDSNGKLIRSPYSYTATGEVSLDKRYPNTTVTGYRCSEALIRAYSVPFQLRHYAALQVEAPGTDNESKYLFYLDDAIQVKSQDVFVTIQLDEDGNVINPVTPLRDFVVIEVPELSEQNGRGEFKIAITKVIK